MSALNLHSTRVVLGRSPAEYRLAAARIEIRDAVIVAIEEGDAQEGDVALGDRLIAPAFVNAHTHLALHACRGLARPDLLRGNVVEDLFFHVEQHLTPDDVEAFARVAALESLLCGVGTVFDHYYHGISTARAMRACGLAGVVAPTLQDRAGPGVGQEDAVLGATEELASNEWRDAGILAAVGPHATDSVSADLWKRALALAAELDLVVHSHVAQSAEEARRSLDEHGKSPVEWLRASGILDAPVRQLFVHALFVTANDLRGLDDQRHALVACPASQAQFGFPAPVSEWSAAGLPFFVGTDTGASNDSMDVQKELGTLFGMSTTSVTWSAPRANMTARLDAKGVDEVEARRVAANANQLRDPRELLHKVWAGPGTWVPGLHAGVIEAGARAQLMILDPAHPAMWPATDPLRALALGGVASAIWGIVAAGEWVGEPGRPQACLELPEVRGWIDEATSRHVELLQRAGIS